MCAVHAWQVESGLRRLSCDPHREKPPRVIFTFCTDELFEGSEENPKISFDLSEEEPTRLAVIYDDGCFEANVTGEIGLLEHISNAKAFTFLGEEETDLCWPPV